MCILKRLFLTGLVLGCLAFPLRIISSAPSITETLFLLGGQDQVVAVTKYCDFPAEAKTKPKIGGLYDFNGEAILLMKPDLVLTQKNNIELKSFLSRHHIDFHDYDNESIEGIYVMIRDIGKLLGKTKQADHYIRKTQSKWNNVTLMTGKNRSHPPVKVLVIVEQIVRRETLESAFILGQDHFYSEMLDALGMKNVYSGKKRYPLIGREAIQSLKPDAIIVLEAGKREWYKHFQAGKLQKVFFMTNDVMKRPGPRFIEILNAFAALSLQAE